MSKFNVTDLVSNLSLEAERKFAAQSNRTARVKIEKGHAWLIRLLPFAQGPGKQPFARIAQHWVGGRAFCCKRHTAPDFGGDPDAYCPVCDVSEEMHGAATDQSDKDAFYGVQARIAYRAYCLVFSKEDNRGKRDDMTPDEILTAHEFMIPKTSFVGLAQKIERSKGRAGGSPVGLLDLETGSDLWVARDIKNSLSFDLSETGPGPIFDLDDNYDTKLQRVWKQLKQPTITFFSDERLNAIADMIAEKAFEKAAKSLENREGNNGSSNGRGGAAPARGGSRGQFHEAEHEEPPARGRTTGRNNGFARAQAALEEPQQQEQNDPGQEQNPQDDQVPGAEVPAQEQAPVTRRRAPVETAASTTETEQQPEGQDNAAEAPPVTRRAAGAPVRRAAAPAAGTRVAVPPSVTRRTGPPSQPGARAAAPAQGGRVEEETPAEDPPEEQRDPAPPQDGAADTAAEQPARATRGTGNLQGQLRQSVSNMASRGR